MIERATTLLLVMLLAAPPAGGKPRLRLERVDPGACASNGSVDAYVAELELEGTLRDRPPSQFRLVLDGRELAERPLRVARFGATAVPLRLALVLESSGSYASSHDMVRAAAQDLLRALPARARVAVVVYDWRARRTLSAATPRQAAAALDAVDPAGGAEVDLALDEALTLGLRALGPRNPLERRLLVVVSDGINRSMKRDVFRALGSRARQLEVPIHPVAFSPIDERGPLLNLGELAKRSRGTLRWARRAADLRGEMLNLAREINEQLVLGFRVPDSCGRRHRLQIATGDLTSDTVELDPTAAAPRAGRRWLRIVAFGGGLGVALVTLTLVALWLARGSSPRRPPPTGRRG
jgi:hypothetical protein